MRATTQKLLEANIHSHFNQLSSTDYEQMLQFGAAAPYANVRINMVQIIGSIGVASTGSSNDSLATMLTNFLLTAASKDTDLRVVAEALDKLFDMYAEDATDQLCVDLELIPKLRQMLPGLKAKIGMSKRTPKGGEFHVIINMAKTNLLRFIKYKEKRPIVASSLKK